MNEHFKSTIKNYLDKRASEDELFAKSYAKENKSLDECCQYILGEARKLGSEVCVSDEVVFGWAVHYYDEDEIKINKTVVGKVKRTSAPDVELSEEEKAKLLEDAKAEYKQVMIDKLIADEKHEAERKAKELASKRKEREEQLQQSQMSIFDVL